MKMLLLGASGQVGSELVRALGPIATVAAATRSGRCANGEACEAIDLASTDAIAPALARVSPDLIVNAAAYTAVDRAEDEPDLADRVNHLALRAIGAFAAKAQIPVIHYSTDYVFDGTASRPYREDDPTAPLGVYGRSKLAGEDALRESGARHLILRTAWVYAAHGHNFLRTMLRLSRERDELRVVNDQIGAPTSAREIADATAAAIGQWMVTAVAEQSKGKIAAYAAPTNAAKIAGDGTYHLVAGGRCSWFDFANTIVAAAHETGLIDKRPRVVPIATAEFPTRARRPAYSVLDTGKFAARFGLNLPSWEDGLRDVIAEIAAARV